MTKILVAMSGGVDSAAAAVLLTRGGYECCGAMMKLFDTADLGLAPDAESGCCSLDDAEAARSAAHKIGIPFHVFNFTGSFKSDVVDPFAAEYRRGRTPNPCLLCNHYLKFERLLKRALELGCDGVATGHYAQIEQGSGGWRLRRAVDIDKDQTYFLYKMTQKQLSKTLFPIGAMRKSEVRELAQSAGLRNAQRAESQDICFVPDGDVGAFVQNYTKTAPKIGHFVDLSGRVLGEHSGIEGYTIGQRRGLGVSGGERLYVVAIDANSGDVTLGPDSALYKTSLTACDVNVIEGLSGEPRRARAKIRYRAPATPATAWLDGDTLRVDFDEPVRAVTPGQAVVVYDGDYVLGGGTIDNRQ